MYTLFIYKNTHKKVQEHTDTDPLTWRSFIEVKPEVVCLLPPQLQPRSFTLPVHVFCPSGVCTV